MLFATGRRPGLMSSPNPPDQGLTGDFNTKTSFEVSPVNPAMVNAFPVATCAIVSPGGPMPTGSDDFTAHPPPDRLHARRRTTEQGNMSSEEQRWKAAAVAIHFACGHDLTQRFTKADIDLAGAGMAHRIHAPQRQRPIHEARPSHAAAHRQCGLDQQTTSPLRSSTHCGSERQTRHRNRHKRAGGEQLEPRNSVTMHRLREARAMLADRAGAAEALYRALNSSAQTNPPAASSRCVRARRTANSSIVKRCDFPSAPPCPD